MKKIVLYTTRYCGFCARAKSFLDSKGLAYEDHDITSDYGQRERLNKKYQWSTVPLVLIDDKLIGGCDELLQLDAKGKLDKLLED